MHSFLSRLASKKNLLGEISPLITAAKRFCNLLRKIIHRMLSRLGLPYTQARSQDLEKGGGAILKEWEKCKRPWPELSLFLNQFHTVCPKIETKFLGKLGNSKVFSAQNQVVSKQKKKGLHRNWDWFFGRNRKFKRFFRPKSGALQIKKKVFNEIETDFRPKSEIQTFFPPEIRWSPKKKKKKK